MGGWKIKDEDEIITSIILVSTLIALVIYLCFNILIRDTRIEEIRRKWEILGHIAANQSEFLVDYNNVTCVLKLIPERHMAEYHCNMTNCAPSMPCHETNNWVRIEMWTNMGVNGSCSYDVFGDSCKVVDNETWIFMGYTYREKRVKNETEN